MRKGLNYALSCRGAPYVWWPQDLDYLPERSPSWSYNDSPPGPSEVIAEGCFCAGVPNLMLRAEGKKIPDHVGDEIWDGGVKAYGDVYGNMGVVKDFDISDCEEGDLLIRYFDWDRLNATGDQGHVAVVLAGGYVLQSYDAGSGYPGVNSNATIEDSNAASWGDYYEGMIKAADWIGFDSDEDRAENPHISAGSPLTEEHLVAIAGCSYEVAAKVLPRTLRVMQEFGITTRLQVAAFLANCAQETDWFNTYEEYGGYDYWLYLDRNSGVEGEWRYHGRGAIMLTWSDNYRRAGEFFGLDFVGNPNLVKEPNTAWRVAGWYWRYGSSMGDINPLADAGNFSKVVKAVNGGSNGWDARVSAYNAALEALPHDLAIVTPDAGDSGGTIPNYLAIGEDGYARFGGDDWTNGYLIWDGTAITQTPCLYVPESG